MSTDGEFEKNVKRLLQEEPIDDEINRRLDAARAKAVASVANADPQPATGRRWLPLAAVASVAGAALLSAYWLAPNPSTGSDHMIATASDDMELLMVEEDLELLEDMEFFLWISVATDEG